MKKSGMVILALSFSAFWTGCSKPQNLELINFRNARLENTGFTSARLSVDLVYYNPNPYRIMLKDANMDVFVNNTLLGHFDRDSLLVIPARDTFYYPVSMGLNLGGALFGVLSNPHSITLSATGSCKVGRKGVFFKVPFQYTAPKDLKLF